MQSKDLLCRAILFPKCAQEGVFDDAALLLLVNAAGDGQMYGLSFGSRYILRDVLGAHSYGCRTAATMNLLYQKRTGSPPPPQKQVHYLGFYDLDHCDLSTLVLDHYYTSVRWVKEHGEDAHFQLELINKGLLGTGKQNDRIRRDDRAAAMEILAMKLKGKPERHICEVDAPLAATLNAIHLPSLPRAIGY
jgi:hypothetical protein